MKKLMTYLIVGIFACLAWSCSDDNDTPDRVVSASDLPKGATTFVNDMYPGATITRAEIDIDKGMTYYDVRLSNGADIEFDSSGDWVKVEAPAGYPVPESIVPDGIKKYMTDFYPQAYVREISRDLYGWEIEISNGLDVYFDNDFNVKRVD